MIPELGGCGRPATRRVELYSSTPGGGLHGSLDGAVHTCAEHETPVKATILAASFIPFSMPLAGPPARCGSGTDFTGTTVRFWSPPEPS